MSFFLYQARYSIKKTYISTKPLVITVYVVEATFQPDCFFLTASSLCIIMEVIMLARRWSSTNYIVCLSVKTDQFFLGVLYTKHLCILEHFCTMCMRATLPCLHISYQLFASVALWCIVALHAQGAKFHVTYFIAQCVFCWHNYHMQFFNLARCHVFFEMCAHL
jgi:hypothetical protein